MRRLHMMMWVSSRYFLLGGRMSRRREIMMIRDNEYVKMCKILGLDLKLLRVSIMRWDLRGEFMRWMYRVRRIYLMLRIFKK